MERARGPGKNDPDWLAKRRLVCEKWLFVKAHRVSLLFLNLGVSFKLRPKGAMQRSLRMKCASIY